MHKGFLVALAQEVHLADEIHGIPVHVCGVGKLNAAIGAHELISKGVTEIINIGSCGSVNHGMGDILKIGRVYQDIDARPICDYGLTPFEDPESFIQIDPASETSCFSSDYFYDHKQVLKYSDDYLGMIKACNVFDMELYAMAKVCRKHGVALSSYKWVSDDGDFAHWAENCKMSLEKLTERFHFSL